VKGAEGIVGCSQKLGEAFLGPDDWKWVAGLLFTNGFEKRTADS